MSEEFAGRVAIHKHDKDWRIRDLKHHPTDPDWKEGTYSLCHEDMRNNMEEPWVFDAVWEKGQLYLRSAFKITKKDKQKNGLRLHFEKYYFNDEKDEDNVIRLSHNTVSKIKANFNGPFSSGRGIRVSKEECDKLIDLMKKCSFNEYSKGEIPKTITPEYWQKMIDAVDGVKKGTCLGDRLKEHDNCGCN